MLIALEGIDGSGKTTVARRLSADTELFSDRVTLVHLPFDSDLTAALSRRGDKMLCAEATMLGFLADAIDVVAKQVRPALQAGNHVILDRYLLSTIGYEGVSVPGGPTLVSELIQTVNRCSASLPTPDVGVLLHCSTTTAMLRCARRGPQGMCRFEESRESVWEQRRWNLLRWAEYMGFEVINAEQSADDVYRQVAALVKGALVLSC